MAELYNEGLFRKGLVRTSGLVRPDLLLTFDDIFSPYAIDRLEAALALDFDSNVYRTGNKDTTFADAFMGTSPKITYDPGSASTSQSTMVNSSGNIVWAPHNLVTYSEDLNLYFASQTGVSIEPAVATQGPILTSQRMVADTSTGFHRAAGALPVQNSTDYTLSCFFKADGQDVCGLGVYTGTTFAARASFDLSTVQETVSNGSATIKSVGGGWYHCAVTGTTTDTNATLYIYVNSLFSATGDGASGIYVYGAHLYRSDLGGMAPVPGAATGFETYVPTNGSAVYLPRVGHHVYNGSAWVNEGLLLESEPRTNLEPNSNSGDPTSYAKIGLDYTGQTLRTTGPDGVADSMLKLQEDTATSSHYATQVITGSVGTNTLSCIVKDAGDGRYVYWRTNNDGANQWINFNPATGEVTEVGTAVNDYGVIDLDGGFYRIWFSCDSNDGNTGWVLGSSNSATPGNSIPSFAGTLEAGLYFGFIQFEAGATPSSYIPTSGSTVIRGGQTLTVPPAEFGWPEPEYIGPNLVDNHDFSLGDNGDWVAQADWSITGGVASKTTGTQNSLYQDLTGVSPDSLYEITFDVSNKSGGGVVVFFTGSNVTTVSGNGLYTFIVKASATNSRISFQGQANTTVTIDNISVREINPLSVSIQMDGRMTYADENDFRQVSFGRWSQVSTNELELRLSTSGTGVGKLQPLHDANNEIAPLSVSDVYEPGNLVPFNVAARFGSTFLNAAADGTTMTAITTPTALPDLSSTDLQIAHDFMGTVGQFRQFAGDIGDAGLVTATNPSTEPTLSLTFDGTGGSFYNLLWSE